MINKTRLADVVQSYDKVISRVQSRSDAKVSSIFARFTMMFAPSLYARHYAIKTSPILADLSNKILDFLKETEHPTPSDKPFLTKAAVQLCQLKILSSNVTNVFIKALNERCLLLPRSCHTFEDVLNKPLNGILDAITAVDLLDNYEKLKKLNPKSFPAEGTDSIHEYLKKAIDSPVPLNSLQKTEVLKLVAQITTAIEIPLKGKGLLSAKIQEIQNKAAALLPSVENTATLREEGAAKPAEQAASQVQTLAQSTLGPSAVKGFETTSSKGGLITRLLKSNDHKEISNEITHLLSNNLSPELKKSIWGRFVDAVGEVGGESSIIKKMTSTKSGRIRSITAEKVKNEIIPLALNNQCTKLMQDKGVQDPNGTIAKILNKAPDTQTKIKIIEHLNLILNNLSKSKNTGSKQAKWNDILSEFDTKISVPFLKSAEEAVDSVKKDFLYGTCSALSSPFNIKGLDVKELIENSSTPSKLLLRQKELSDNFESYIKENAKAAKTLNNRETTSYALDDSKRIAKEGNKEKATIYLNINLRMKKEHPKNEKEFVKIINEVLKAHHPKLKLLK